jgi:hypothetical protein
MLQLKGMERVTPGAAAHPEAAVDKQRHKR